MVKATFKTLVRILKAAITSVTSGLLSVCPNGPRAPLGGGEFSSNFRHYWEVLLKSVDKIQFSLKRGNIFLTVHLRIILVGNQLDAQFLL